MKFRTTDQIRAFFLDFFKEKGHAILPSASLIPENDPTVLFTTAGMQPLVPYFLGEVHPEGTRLANAQKCLRTDDIEEVGDASHGTFFEMLGNWSLGDYFKEESIAWSYEFLTKPEWMGMDPSRLFVTIFSGDADAPRDEQSAEIWKAQFEVHGIDAQFGETGTDAPAETGSGPRIYAYGKNKNWWGPAGQTGPCGPDTEIFYDTGKAHDSAFGSMCHPNCDCGRFVEIWNNVFMEYRKTETGSFEALNQKNVDTGMGLERIAAILQNVPTIYDTDAYQKIIQSISLLTSQTLSTDSAQRSIRIIADHLRAATFIIGDPRGVAPSNVGQGYIVRRLIRRAVREARRIGAQTAVTETVCRAVVDAYQGAYPELAENQDRIFSEASKEEEKFGQTLEKGLKEFERRYTKGGHLSGEDAFILYSTYGFPLELTEELIQERGGSVDRLAFEKEFSRHQELSRTAAAGTFKGGLADQSEQTMRLHTATHLLHEALRRVLGSHVEQRGSNITAERLRFDFTHPQKMTDEEKRQVEEMVNAVIQKDLPLQCEDLTVAEAKEKGAIGLFDEKYGNRVKVYTVEDPDEARGFFSREICGGPHVTHTGELGHFRIKKEEAVSAGVRRIKAVISGLKD